MPRNAPQGDGGAVVADTFNRQFDRDKLEILKERIETLRQENDDLKGLQQKGERDTHEFVAYFQREMEKKDELIAALNDQVIENESAFEEERQRTKAESAARLSELEEQSESTESALRTRLKLVEDELAKLTAFRDMKAVLEQRTEDVTEELRQCRVDHEEQINALERKFLEEKARMRRETDERVAAIQKASREEAQSGLDADTRKIVTDNRRMGEELRFQLQTTGELQREKARLEGETRRLQREVALNAEKEAVYAKQAHKQSRLTKELQTKVKSLERSLSQVVRDFEKERAQLVQTTRKDLEEQTMDATGLRQLLRLKNKELKHVRRLAQAVLDQRTEVEQYFLEALEQVKAEIRHEREQKLKAAEAEFRQQMRAAGHARGVKFPRIRPREELAETAASALPQSASTRVDLRDLSWEDRERVLRLLFAKINNVQGFVDAMPPHSFDPESAGGEGFGDDEGGGGMMMPTPPTTGGPASFGFAPGTPGSIPEDGEWGAAGAAMPVSPSLA